MAEYYSQFSFEIPVTDQEELDWWYDVKAQQAEHAEHADAVDYDIDDEWRFDFEIETQQVWFYCDDQGSELEPAANKVSEFLEYFNRNDVRYVIVVGWCSKPALNEQVASVALISREGVEFKSIHELGDAGVRYILNQREQARQQQQQVNE